MIGNAYKLDGMALLVVDKIRDTYIISLQKYRSGIYIQFPFVPIHKSFLQEFVESAEFAGKFTPASIEHSLELWRQHQSCYFTLPPKDIWDMAVYILSDSGKKVEEFRVDDYILFPPIFPGTPSTLNGSEGIVYSCSETIGQMSDANNN